VEEHGRERGRDECVIENGLHDDTQRVDCVLAPRGGDGL
jgi:hypothetical protein